MKHTYKCKISNERGKHACIVSLKDLCTAACMLKTEIQMVQKADLLLCCNLSPITLYL